MRQLKAAYRRTAQSCRMAGRRHRFCESLFPDRQDEQARPALGSKPPRIDHDQVDKVTEFSNSRTDVVQVVPRVRRQESRHVLKEQSARGRHVPTQLRHQLDERPYGTRMLPSQPRSITRERQIDTGERSGQEIKIFGKIRSPETVNVANQQVLLAKSGGVHFRLLVRDIVGKLAVPAERFDRLPYQAYSSKELSEPSQLASVSKHRPPCRALVARSRALPTIIAPTGRQMASNERYRVGFMCAHGHHDRACAGPIHGSGSAKGVFLVVQCIACQGWRQSDHLGPTFWDPQAVRQPLLPRTSPTVTTGIDLVDEPPQHLASRNQMTYCPEGRRQGPAGSARLCCFAEANWRSSSTDSPRATETACVGTSLTRSGCSRTKCSG